MESSGTGVEDSVGTSGTLGEALQAEQDRPYQESLAVNCEHVREPSLKLLWWKLT